MRKLFSNQKILINRILIIKKNRYLADCLLLFIDIFCQKIPNFNQFQVHVDTVKTHFVEPFQPAFWIALSESFNEGYLEQLNDLHYTHFVDCKWI